MVLPQEADGNPHVERRAYERFRIDLPARLRMPSGDRAGRLADISDGGARLHLNDPPRAGVSALLQWGSHEFFCKIAWARDDSCGLTFERPIPHAVVIETTGGHEAPRGPAATPGNIPLGKKRSRRPPSG